MLKYVALLILVLAIAVFYVSIADPCDRQVRLEFSNKYPSYEFLDSRASEGSPETVRCRISYRKPGSEQVHEEIWLYLNPGNGWEFSRILETGVSERMP